MDISEVAKKSGIPASTLRYYEEKGLITSVGRQGLKRVFKPVVLEKLALIALGQAAGLSLNDILQMFGADGKPNINRSMLNAKADHIDRQIIELKAMSKGLRHAAVCPAENHLECPTFQRLLRAAATGSIARKKRKPLKNHTESANASER